MNDAIISLRNLSYTYAANQDVALRQPALSDISLEIARGSCVAIIGVTGSGKSTLVQHFNGLLKPTGGTVIVNGIEVSAPHVDLLELRQQVGMLFQFPEAQLFERSIFADVAFGLRRMHLARREIRTRVIKALEMVGLPFREYAQRSPFELSGGQRRRVALAGVLAMRPVILVLDEPGAGLDAEGKAEFYAQIQTLKQQGLTIILVSHDMAEVAALADTLFVLHAGRLVMRGAPRDVFAQPAALHDYGLAPPPLSILSMHLRQRGLDVPANLATIDDFVAFFVRQRSID